MKIEGYEEISREEYNKLRGYGGLYVDDSDSGKVRWFKKVQKFPIVFEDDERKVEVNKEDITINDLYNNSLIIFNYNQSFPLLIKAVEKAKEVMKKNEKNN